MNRELKRRWAIEPTMGHMKTDGRLDRNHLFGHAGDAVNVLLAAAGHNLRLRLNVLALWLAWIMAITDETEKRNTGTVLPRIQKSMGSAFFRTN